LITEMLLWELGFEEIRYEFFYPRWNCRFWIESFIGFISTVVMVFYFW